MPTRTRVQRSSSTSGAPLVISTTLVAVLVVDLDRRHHLALGRERDLADALEAPLAPLGDAQLALGHQERRLGGVALDLPLAARASGAGRRCRPGCRR